MFPVSDLPQLSKGKGNKIINIPSAEAARGEDRSGATVRSAAAKHADHSCSGKRKIQTASRKAAKVTGERGRRGTLMRGLQRIDRVEIDSPRRASSGDSEGNMPGEGAVSSRLQGTPDETLSRHPAAYSTPGNE